MKRITLLRLLASAALLGGAAGGARAQHTFGITGGYGLASGGRFYPAVESRSITGALSYGVSWRYYTEHRFVGCVGLDLEVLERGFSFAPNAAYAEEKSDYLYYTRRTKSVQLPIVWQPHFYLANRHLRIHLDAALTLSYHFGSTYDNRYARETAPEGPWSGDYAYRTERDNRWGYGLAGGGGASVLVGRFEVGVGVRYYFGLSDILRNRNKYYGNPDHTPDNPFPLTPLRSPLDNLMVRAGIAYRFAPEFKSWSVKPRKREKGGQGFKYRLD